MIVGCKPFDLDKILELIEFVDSLNTCQYTGHEFVRMWTGSGTVEIPICAPLTCRKCGAVAGCDAQEGRGWS